MMEPARTGSDSSDTGLIDDLRVQHDGLTPARQLPFPRAGERRSGLAARFDFAPVGPISKA